MTRPALPQWLRDNLATILALGAAAAALGYAVQTPGAQIHAMRVSVDTLRGRVGTVEQRLDAMATTRRQDNDSLFRLLRQIQSASCLIGDQRDLALIGIPCSTLVRDARRAAQR